MKEGYVILRDVITTSDVKSIRDVTSKIVKHGKKELINPFESY